MIKSLLYFGFFGLLISGCSGDDLDFWLFSVQKTDCDVSTYAGVRADNQVDEDVAIHFCTDPTTLYSKLDQKAQSQSSTYFSSTVVHKVESHKIYAYHECRDEGYRPTYLDINYFASLSSVDLLSYRLCYNTQGYRIDLDGNKIPQQYIIINRLDSCPVDSVDYDQTSNPC